MTDARPFEQTSDTARTVVPLGDWIFIEKIVKPAGENKTPGGIIIPDTFDHKHRASLKHGAVPDYFEARVLAKGPRVPADVTQFTKCLVYTYAEGDGKRLYTGEQVNRKNQLFVKIDDILCMLDDD